MLTASGELDRRQMRELVFADAGARRQLEAILHPKILASLLASSKECTGTYCLLAIPLLAESRLDYSWVDRALLVDVPLETQLDRLMRRDNISRDAALHILAAQATRAQRLELADDVIENDYTLDALDAVVERLHHRYLELAAEKSRNLKRPAGE